MTQFITGDTRTLRKYMQAVVNMQTWIDTPEAREEWIFRVTEMGSKVILAVDDRHRLIGSFLFYPSINDNWIKEHADHFPFDLEKAFTITLVWVHESQRGKGLGKQLFEKAHGMAKEQGMNVRLGYGATTKDIWSFTKAYSNPTIVDGIEYDGQHIQYTLIK